MGAASEQDRNAASGETVAGTSNRAALRAGGIAGVVAGLAGIVLFALELMGPVLGFADTDNPAVSLDYLRQYPQFYALAAVVSFVTALAYIVASFAMSDVLEARTSSIGRRSLSALGLFAAAFFFMHGVLRESVGPMLYIESIDSAWGESAYLTVQMLGTHGFLGAGLLMLGIWSTGICVAGVLSRSLPIWLCVLGLVTNLRLVILMAGPLMAAASNRGARDLACLSGTDSFGNALVADPRPGAAFQVPAGSPAARYQHGIAFPLLRSSLFLPSPRSLVCPTAQKLRMLNVKVR